MAKQHLLLVDNDAKSLRVMEVSLKKAGFSVTTAIHGRDALEKVQISPPDLVLADTKMPEMDGFELCRALKSDDRLRTIPFVFLTNQKSVEFKVKGLELGGDDYLTKPIYIKEIVTRVKMILQKAEKERLERRESRGGFSGNLADMGVVDLVQTFEIGRKTGTIVLEGERARGAIFFREGKVIDADLGRLVGENAFYRMLNTFDGKFEVQFGPVDRKDRIEISTQGLLMEGMRRLDDWGRMLEQLPPLETLFEVDPRQLADRLSEIPDEVNGLLRLFDGKRSLSRVVEDSDFEDLAALGIISKLYFEGLIRELGSITAAPIPARPGSEAWLQGPAIMKATSPASASRALNGASPPSPPPVPALAPSAPPADPQSPAPASGGPARVIVFQPRRAPKSRSPEAAAAASIPTPVVGAPPHLAGALSAPDPTPVSLPSAMDRAKQAFLLEWGKDDSEGAGIASPAWGAAPGWSPVAFAPVPAPATPDPNGATRRSVSTSAALPPYLPVPPPPPITAFAPDPIPLSNPEPIPLSNPEPAAPPSLTPRRASVFGGAAGESRPQPAPSAVIVSPVPLTPPQFPNAATGVPPPPLPPPLPGQAPALATSVPLPAPVAAPTQGGPGPSVVPEIASGEPRTPAILPPEGVVVFHPEDLFRPSDAPVPGPEAQPDTRRRRMTPLWIGLGVGALLAAAGAIAITLDPPPTGAHVEELPPAVAGPAAAPIQDAPAVAAVPAPTPEPPPAVSPPPAAAPVEPPVPVAVSPASLASPTPAAPGPATPAAEPDFPRLMRQGTSALKGERFTSAARAFRAALAQKPDSLEAKAGLGVALVSQGTGYKEAIDLLQEVVKADDGNAQAWLSLGMAHQFTGAVREARDAYKKYLLLAPTGEAAGDVRAMLKELGQ